MCSNLGFNHACETAQSIAISIYIYITALNRKRVCHKLNADRVNRRIKKIIII